LKKEDRFIRKRYLKVLRGLLVFFFISLVGEFIDFFLAGRLFGEKGVSVIEVIVPIYSFACGFASLISTGFAAMYTHALGEFKKERAEEIFGQSIITAAVLGIAIYALLRIFLRKYLLLSGCSGELMEECFRYGRIFILISVIYPMFYLVNSLVESDGCGSFLIANSVVGVVTHFVCSLFFGKRMGIYGISLGLVSGLMASLLFACLHFFRKKCSIKRLRLFFSFRDLKDMVVYGTSGMLNYLMISVVDVAFNGYVIRHFGADHLGPYAIVNLVLDMGIIFESFAMSSVPFVGVYFGEGNRRGVTLSMRALFKSVLIGGAVYSGLFIGCSRWVPLFYGIRTPATYDMSVFAVVTVSAFGVFIAINYVLMEVFPFIDRTDIGILSGVLHSGVLPLLLGILLGNAFGFRGMIIGLALVPVATAAIVVIVLLLKNGRKGFPLYLKDNGEKQYVFSFAVNDQGREEICAAAEECLRNEGVEDKLISRIRLLLYEMVIRIAEENAGNAVDGECGLMISENEVRLLLRDDGKLFDLTDSDSAPVSMNAFLLSRMMAGIRFRDNMLAASLNRSSLTFSRK